jgi:hypothetical protein
MLESPLALSVRTSNIRVRLGFTNRKVIESMVNSLLDWVHGSDNAGQQFAISSAAILSPPLQIPVPQRPHRTLSIDICHQSTDFSWTKHVENFIFGIMKVKYNLIGLFYKCPENIVSLALLIGRDQDFLLDCGANWC